MICLKLKSESRDILFLDINECSTGADACDVNAKCKNTVGSYTCICKNGFTGNGETCTGKIYLSDWFIPSFSDVLLFPRTSMTFMDVILK